MMKNRGYGLVCEGRDFIVVTYDAAREDFYESFADKGDLLDAIKSHPEIFESVCDSVKDVDDMDFDELFDCLSNDEIKTIISDYRTDAVYVCYSYDFYSVVESLVMDAFRKFEEEDDSHREMLCSSARDCCFDIYLDDEGKYVYDDGDYYEENSFVDILYDIDFEVDDIVRIYDELKM